MPTHCLSTQPCSHRNPMGGPLLFVLVARILPERLVSMIVFAGQNPIEGASATLFKNFHWLEKMTQQGISLIVGTRWGRKQTPSRLKFTPTAPEDESAERTSSRVCPETSRLEHDGDVCLTQLLGCNSMLESCHAKHFPSMFEKYHATSCANGTSTDLASETVISGVVSCDLQHFRGSPKTIASSRPEAYR